MIDTLVINIPIRHELVKVLSNNQYTIIGDVSYYGLRSVGDIRRNLETGEIKYTELKHPFESISSSYDGMAIKFYHIQSNTYPYMMLKASPKILQGHNVYGTDKIQTQVFEMMGMLKEIYPEFFLCLDIQKAYISRIDATYSCRLANEELVGKANKAIGNIQVGQRKPNKKRGKEKGYQTNYWGSEESRIGDCKSYGKHQDVKRDIEKYQRSSDRGNTHSKKMLEIFNQELLDYSSGLLRFESSTRKQKLHELGIPSNVWQFIIYQRQNDQVLQAMWHYWFDPIFSAFKGEIMQDIDDEAILTLCREKLVSYNAKGKATYTKAHNAYNFYKILKMDGWEKVKSRMNERSFRRDVKSLCEIGIPRVTLQSLQEQKGENVPLFELIKMDFSQQFPDDYCPPTSKYAREFQEYLKPELYLVA